MEEDNLGYFDKEELFPTDTRRKPQERVNFNFKRIYSLPPIDILIRAEEAEVLKKRGKELQELCEKHLTFQEYAFLMEQLGKEFGNHLRMPLEFRDFSNGDFEKYFVKNLDKYKERISILMESASINEGRFNKRIMESPFALASKDLIYRIYNDVREKNGKYPKGFFSAQNKRIARILVRHLIDNVLKIPHRKVLLDVNREIFEKNKLGLLLDVCYEGTVNPVYCAIQDTYSHGGYPDIHNPDYRPKNPVKALMDKLKAY